MKFRSLCLIATLTIACRAQSNWPQAAGPEGTWQARGTAPPLNWSVALNRNILWRTPLPNGGQSGIAVWGDRLFLTTFSEYTEGTPKFSGTYWATASTPRPANSSGPFAWKDPKKVP
jgi:hypothetical protein